MSDRQETIADIIAEMKREAAKIFPELPIAVLKLAARLEAAWKREKNAAEVGKPSAAVGSPSVLTQTKDIIPHFEAAHKRELTKPAENVNSVEASDTAGNCAKLREAMVEILEYIESFHKYIIPGKRKKLTTLFAVADTIRDKARAALAAPPRNCDIQKVTEDPHRAWLDDKSNWDEFGSPKLEIYDWLLAPAKEGGAK